MIRTTTSTSAALGSRWTPRALRMPSCARSRRGISPSASRRRSRAPATVEEAIDSLPKSCLEQIRPRRLAMTEHTLETLTRRLERLEGENRWLKCLTLMLLLGIAAAGLMGQTAPHRPLRALEAEEFLLRDNRGQVRASLGTTQNPSAAVLQIHHENGNPPMRLIVSGDGTSSLEVLDSSDRIRALLGVRDSGTPRVWLGNEAGKIVWRAP